VWKFEIKFQSPMQKIIEFSWDWQKLFYWQNSALNIASCKIYCAAILLKIVFHRIIFLTIAFNTNWNHPKMEYYWESPSRSRYMNFAFFVSIYVLLIERAFTRVLPEDFFDYMRLLIFLNHWWKMLTPLRIVVHETLTPSTW